ncbi:MAG TPA: EamA family transporter [Xanthobacteraceae bacterium]|nr:EamA family transporter [Xanthobacteraceae bacterium]
MNRDLEQSVARAAPGIFVVLWSTGFIGTKYVLDGAEPLTYLTLRMALVAVLMGLIVLVTRSKLPNLVEIGHSAVAGLLIQAIYLGGVSVAMYHSVPAGLAALIPGMQPILTSTLANRWLGERVTKLQWAGLVCGLIGVVMVLHGRQMTGEVGWAWLGTCVALVSITLGTLYQKRYCGKIDWRAGNLVQFAASAVVCGIGAWLFETRNVDWSLQFTLSLFWLAIVLSIGSVGVLYWLIRRGTATQAASLFYLVPATTALMAFVLFGERLDFLGIIGMALCAAGVVLVNKPSKKNDPVLPKS